MLTVLTRTTKQALLTTARDLFLEGGLESVSLRAVARSVGVSATAVYRHFRNKEDLLRNVVLEGYSLFDAALATVDHTQLPHDQRLRLLTEAYWDFGLSEPRYYQIIFQSHDVISYSELPVEMRKAEWRSLERLVALCGETLAYCIWTSLHGVVSLVIAGRIPELQGRAIWSETLKQLTLDFFKENL